MFNAMDSGTKFGEQMVAMQSLEDNDDKVIQE